MKKAVLIFCDNNISHNIPMLGIANVLNKKGHKVSFCGSHENSTFFKNHNFEYIASDIFDLDKPNVVRNVDLGFFEIDTLHSITNGALDKLIDDVKPSIILFSYYISYLLPFFKKQYDTIKYCCVNILLRGELFTPKYLYNFHYETSDVSTRKKIDKILQKFNGNKNQTIHDIYKDFKELILCPKELDMSSKYTNQNVEYSEAITGDNQIEQYQDREKDNIILFSMGSYSNLFPLVINKIVEKIIQCAILLKQRDPSFKFIFSVPDGVLNTTLIDACKRENLTLVNWFDQTKLLNTAKLMITHGGIGSIKECIYAKTPMLCFPLTRDQPYNTKRIESLGLGKKLHPLNTDVNEIFKSLTELLDNEEYLNNLDTFRKIFYKYKEKETLYNQLMKIAG